MCETGQGVTQDCDDEATHGTATVRGLEARDPAGQGIQMQNHTFSHDKASGHGGGTYPCMYRLRRTSCACSHPA